MNRRQYDELHAQDHGELPPTAKELKKRRLLKRINDLEHTCTFEQLKGVLKGIVDAI